MSAARDFELELVFVVVVLLVGETPGLAGDGTDARVRLPEAVAEVADTLLGGRDGDTPGTPDRVDEGPAAGRDGEAAKDADRERDTDREGDADAAAVGGGDGVSNGQASPMLKSSRAPPTQL